MIESKDQAVQDLIKTALASLERGDAHSLAFALRRAAEIGQLAEGTALGTAIQHLEVVPSKIAERAKTLLEEEVATGSYPTANYALARLWSLGLLGLPKDETMAFHYLRQAADLGLVEANFYLGIYAHEGIGCVPDTEVAKAAFHEATRAGYLFAERQLVAMDTSLGAFTRWFRMTSIAIEAFKLSIQDPTNYRLFLLNPKATLWRK
jgi:TPR repeat protein